MWLELVFEVNEPENIRRPVQAPLKPSITEHSMLDSHMINLFCYTLDTVACIGFAAIKPVSDTPLPPPPLSLPPSLSLIPNTHTMK